MALMIAVAASAGPAPAAEGSAREISEAERAAVQLSVEYLAGGPEAVLRSLAVGSRLKRCRPPTPQRKSKSDWGLLLTPPGSFRPEPLARRSKR